MSSGDKPEGVGAPGRPHREKGVKIFTYPKVIFIFPTLVAALVCGLWMSMLGNDLHDPGRASPVLAPEDTAKVVVAEKGEEVATAAPAEAPTRMQRFTSQQNLLAMGFLLVFAFNLLIMAVDFPRFTVMAGFLMIAALTFFLLWLGMFFKLDLVSPLTNFLEGIYAVANAAFYFMIAAILLMIFGIIFITRWLDYWEILPNEILHHHGPLSDLERYPTFNLKFDKEIPDLLEYLFLGSGRLVLHVANERKSIVLDNVLWISQKEIELKKLMSRLDVRITTDQEVPE